MSLTELYQNTREYSIDQTIHLETEDFIAQPVDFVSPPKWNLAHTTWFFEEFILKQALPGYKVFNKNYSYLFNSYYVNVGDRLSRGHRGMMTRPALREILSYREYVDKAMVKFLETKIPEKMVEVLMTGIHHEQQHQELFLSDVKYILGTQPFFPPYNKNALCETGSAGTGKWIQIPEGIYEIGYKGNGFHYDNEKSVHKVFLHDYYISDKLVSNREYLEFLENGGYENANFWHSDGISWLERERVKCPLYWHKIDGEWYQYTLAGLKKLRKNSPVCHISYYEAFAYAQWKGLRLATEFEWEAASDRFEWGHRWEWTESSYLPYPAYKKPGGALGEYNGKFMVNQKVLRGSSVATSPGHSRYSYRNFFQPDLSWQFTGIRLAKS